VDDLAFGALKLEVHRLGGELLAKAAEVEAATEELLAEIRRRDAGQPATVHPIRPGHDGE
jgi:hypothetical protein